MSPSNNFNLDWIFTYHPPKPDQLPRYERIRSAAKTFAQVLLEETPFCADQSAALRHLRECVMTANAAIAMEGSLLGPSDPATQAKNSVKSRFDLSQREEKELSK